MALLLIFAFLAGVVTVLSPCIIPVLPAILSAGTGKGAYRPLGIVTGLVISFTFFTLALTAIVHATGISPNALRYTAIFIIAFFGVVMIFPSLSNWFSRSTSSISALGDRIQSQEQSISSGFGSGFILGLALGLVWTPCAGPILAAITTLVAIHAVNWSTVLLTLAYSIGAAIPMFLIAYGGNRALRSSRYLSRHAEGIRQIFGFLMILTAVAIATNLDFAFQQLVLSYFPPVEVEDIPFVRKQLSQIRAPNEQSPIQAADETAPGQTLPKIAPVPDFVGITHWLNSPPLTMASLKGKVVLVDFWTYSCINCIRTLPYIKKWYDTYKDKGFVVVGVHTPEFEFEKNTGNVADAIKRLDIRYPVAQDNDYKTWQAYYNMYWPADYLIDRNGIIREVHFGEGGYIETENSIRALLDERPLKMEEAPASEKHRPITPETYLGYGRGSQYVSGIELKDDKIAQYSYKGPLEDDEVGLSGKWLVEKESITAKGDSRLDLNFLATKVYLVLGGHSDKPIKVLLDDKPIPKEYYTVDMDADGQIYVKEPRMYTVINLKKDYGRHKLSLLIPPGISVYAFTFGDE